MKKYVLLLVLLLLVSISGCTTNDSSTSAPQNPDPTLHMEKEGIEPFAFTERENFLLSAFSMKQNVALFTCKLPKEIVNMYINVHTLQKDGTWDSYPSVGILRPSDEDTPMEGSIALVFQEDNSIRVNALGGSTVIPSPNLDFTTALTYRESLREHKEVVPNQEIPLIITEKDSGSGLNSCSVEDYFTPETFRGVDFVQVITVTFSDKIDEPKQ